MNVGAAIQKIRKRLNLSQKELAEKSVISQTSLSQIESGIKKPSKRTILKLCKVLDIPEAVIYLLAMEATDIAENKRNMYALIQPSIVSLSLELVSSDAREQKAKPNTI